MTDFTAADVERAFDAWQEENDDAERIWYQLECMDSKYGEPALKVDSFPQFGPLSYVDGYTGGEGGGENAYIVFKFGDRYFRKQGYYASHYGTDWDGEIREVKPVERTVTFYE